MLLKRYDSFFFAEAARIRKRFLTLNILWYAEGT